MGYYIRVLGKRNPDIHIDELLSRLTNGGLTANLDVDPKDGPENWTVIRVANSNGENLMQIERNPVIDGELGKEELEEFREKIKGNSLGNGSGVESKTHNASHNQSGALMTP